jgi:hypothetical protein
MLRTFLGTVHSPFQESPKAYQCETNFKSSTSNMVLTRIKFLDQNPLQSCNPRQRKFELPSPPTKQEVRIIEPSQVHHCTKFKHSDGNQSTPTQQLEKTLHTKYGLMCLGKYTTLSSPQILSQERDDATSCKLKNISESTQLHKSTQPQGPLSHQRKRDSTTSYKWKHISKSTQHHKSAQPHLPLSHQREMRINITGATTSLV